MDKARAKGRDMAAAAADKMEEAADKMRPK